MPNFGEKIPIRLQLFDKNSSKFAKASLFDASTNDELTTSPIVLTNAGNGLYTDYSLVMPNIDNIICVYIVYSDITCLVRDETYEVVEELFSLTEKIQEVEVLGEVEAPSFIGETTSTDLMAGLDTACFLGEVTGPSNILGIVNFTNEIGGEI